MKHLPLVGHRDGRYGVLNRRSWTVGRFLTEEEAGAAAAAFRAEHMPFSREFVEREKENHDGAVA